MVNGVLPKGTKQSGTEQNILQNKSNFKCINSSRQVINAIYSVEEYANLATTNVIIINND